MKQPWIYMYSPSWSPLPPPSPPWGQLFPLSILPWRPIQVVGSTVCSFLWLPDELLNNSNSNTYQQLIQHFSSTVLQEPTLDHSFWVLSPPEVVRQVQLSPPLYLGWSWNFGSLVTIPANHPMLYSLCSVLCPCLILVLLICKSFFYRKDISLLLSVLQPFS